MPLDAPKLSLRPCKVRLTDDSDIAFLEAFDATEREGWLRIVAEDGGTLAVFAPRTWKYSIPIS